MNGEPAAAEWTQVLRAALEIASQEHDLTTVLQGVADLVVAATRGDVCFVHVVDREADETVLMGASPAAFAHLAGTVRLPIGEGVAGWVAQHGEVAVVDDKWSDERYRYIPELRGEEYSSLVSVPLLRPPATVVGVLNVHATAPGHFTAGVVARLEEVAHLLAGLVEGAVLHDRLVRREEELERAAIRSIEVQEFDRRRIAGDIHDGISQRLVSAWYHLRAAHALTDDEAVRSELTAVDGLLSDALDEARRAIVGLRPQVLDDLGLAAAITSVAGDLAEAEVTLELADLDLPPHLETTLYRLTQEALQNVAKHAAARRVDVRLHGTDTEVVLAVADDGVGFDPGTAGTNLSFGLAGMEERAAMVGGHLHVDSRPGAGTTLVVTLPVARS